MKINQKSCFCLLKIVNKCLRIAKLVKLCLHFLFLPLFLSWFENLLMKIVFASLAVINSKILFVKMALPTFTTRNLNLFKKCRLRLQGHLKYRLGLSKLITCYFYFPKLQKHLHFSFFIDLKIALAYTLTKTVFLDFRISKHVVSRSQYLKNMSLLSLLL